jgi:serine/threonine-protein kinase
MATAGSAPQNPNFSPVDTDVALPQRLGRFLLLKLIARGGMGEVFLAATGDIEGAERPVVVKLIRREHAKDASFMARFLDEARVQAQLQHPGVAQIVEASMDEGGQPYVAVEYVEGRSLAEVRARAIQLGHKIGWAEAVAVCASVAESLAHVHERHDSSGRPLAIAHRDLSPQNVMVGFAGETKLIDFGTARGANRRSRTVAGVVYAKPGYVAPEVANGIPGDALVDVYALGVMLWELCSGRRFLQGDASEHMAAVAQNRRPMPPVAPAAGAPADLDSVIARMTAHDKNTRLSAREAQSELARLLSMAPSLPGGERGVRARVSALLSALYSSEPKRSRSEFYKLLAQARLTLGPEDRARKIAAPNASEEQIQREIAEGLLPGTRYRVVRKIGEGAGGVVFEGVHIDLNRKVALKVLTPERAARPTDAARFRREAWALSKISHRNAVKLYDFGVASDGRLFFAMEYLEGETLERLLGREKAIALADALRIARETSLALEAAHEVGLVHRDIKPDNLFLTRDGGVKVLDFGVVCAPGDGSGKGEGATPSLAFFGTPEYMAPEQIDGSPIDGRADIYALGSVLYEMVTGRLPFADTSSVSLLDLKRKLDPEAPGDRAPSRRLPRELDALVLKAMKRNPAERFASAAELRAAIERVERLATRGNPRRRALGFAAVAAVMVGALALLGAGSPHTPGAQPEAVRTALAKVEPFFKMFRGAPVATPITEPTVAAVPAPAPAPPAPAPEPESEAAPAPPGSVVNAVAFPESSGQTQLAAVGPKTPAVVPMDPAELDALKDKARKAAGKRRWKTARKFAEEWVKADASAEPRLLLARSLKHGGLEVEAAEIVQELLDREPENQEAKALLSELKKAKPRVVARPKAPKRKTVTAKKR